MDKLTITLLIVSILEFILTIIGVILDDDKAITPFVLFIITFILFWIKFLI